MDVKLRNKKVSIAILLFFIIVIIIISTLISEKNNKYQVLSDNEIENFVKDQKIVKVAVENVKNTKKPHAIVLYTDNDKIGNYILTKKDKKIEKIKSLEIKRNKNKKFETLGVQTGSPFISIVINDGDLLKNSNDIEVTFDNKHAVTRKIKQNKKYYIISSHRLLNQEKINTKFIIFDKQNKPLVIH
ncbi:hypothetical protein ACQKJC_22380 [Priestia koreensis]|uniref:hypothetical protein n=1 Tax=Priestia koreensis TaxID=284581 RepID=UPI003D0831ED